MSGQAIQEMYPEDLSHCYGCGRLNEHGYQLKTHREGDETVTRFTPEPYHIAIPGYVYGGLIASLMDCHGTGTAAAMKRKEIQDSGGGRTELVRYVTASLQVEYLRPAPLGVELEVRGSVVDSGERKMVITAEVIADGEVCAKGKVVAVRVTEEYLDRLMK